MLGSRSNRTFSKAPLSHTNQIINFTLAIQFLVYFIPYSFKCIQQTTGLYYTENSKVAILTLIKALLNITGSRNILGSNDLFHLMNNTIDGYNVTL